ncbi:rubredoxin-like domain-containing protein [Tannockella kyphosi]|uniref:rubredoxin-like domain-containing protein n=1 Tax=Tannockella kyphosi TaxID=2899121 RepID=UPI002010DAA9|nr:rubredoxin [Tannockella kyphosi]
MEKWKCSICGYIHDEQENGLFKELPDEYVCPLCKAEKSAFVLVGETVIKKETNTNILLKEFYEFTNLEKSILCSNLARGCQKQYLEREASLFTQLANYFHSNKENAISNDFVNLVSLNKFDIDSLIPTIEAVSTKHNDRGALRALAWNQKVSMISYQIMENYKKDKTLENQRIHVCTICGFIYIGDSLPELCPICKVPNYKFEEIKGGL